MDDPNSFLVALKSNKNAFIPTIESYDPEIIAYLCRGLC